MPWSKTFINYREINALTRLKQTLIFFSVIDPRAITKRTKNCYRVFSARKRNVESSNRNAMNSSSNVFFDIFSCFLLSSLLGRSLFSRTLKLVLNLENRKSSKTFRFKNSFTQLNFGFLFSHFSRCLNRHVVSWERKRRRTSLRIYADEILTSDTIVGVFFCSALSA